MKPPVLDLRNLSFRLGKRKLLNDLSLKIGPGELCLLCGESGIGKSTFLKVLNGYYPANGGSLDNGQILVSGKDLTHFPSVERSQYLTVLFQNAAGSFSMPNLRQEMIFCLENLKTPPASIDTIIKETREKLSIDHLIDQPFSILSGGELELCALAIAELYPGNLYLLDEPFANLDEDSIKFIKKWVMRWLSFGKAVLVVDHRPDHWKEASRVLLLDQAGHLQKADSENLSANGVTVDWTERLEKYRKKTGNPPLFPSHTLQKKNVPILELHNFTLSVGAKKTGLFRRCWKDGRNILQADHLEFPQGKLIALTGPSGSGKSSFFRALLGECAYTGQILLNGKDLAKLKNKEIFNTIGIVFQDPALQFVKLDVASEIGFSLKAQRYPKQSYILKNQKHLEQSYNPKSKKRSKQALKNLSKGPEVQTLLEAYHLEGKADISPWLLSQGEQRRLAVLTMLPGARKLLLVDEPTYGQDLRHAAEIMETLKDLTYQNMSCIFISHDSILISQYADAVFEIKDGKLKCK